MDLENFASKVVLLCFVVGVQAGCGDDGGGFVWVEPELTCAPGAEGEGSSDLEVSNFTLPDAEKLAAADVPGFDLDGLGSGACGAADFGSPATIDNGLSRLTSGLDQAVGLTGADSTVNEEIQRALDSNEIDMTMSVRGWNGAADDGCVLVDFDSGTGTPVTDRLGAVSGGVLYVELGEFDMSIPLGGPTGTFAVHGALATLDMDTLEGTVGGVIHRGSPAGEETYTEALGIAAPEGTVFRTIYDLIEAIAALASLNEDDRVALHGAAAIFFPSSGEETAYDVDGLTEGGCDGTSLGFTFTAVEGAYPPAI